MEKKFNLSRKQAAQMLGVSTRSIDRYIRAGKLSYKKIANKVRLTYDEIIQLQNEFSDLHQEVSTEIINNKPSTTNTPSVQHTASTSLGGLESVIDKKLDKFFTVFNEKDKMLEDKNKLIFMLQQRIWELETRLQNMIALPDYNKEKQATIIEKQKLETKISELRTGFKKERSKNSIFIGIMILVIILFLIFWSQS